MHLFFFFFCLFFLLILFYRKETKGCLLWLIFQPKKDEFGLKITLSQLSRFYGTTARLGADAAGRIGWGNPRS